MSTDLESQIRHYARDLADAAEAAVAEPAIAQLTTGDQRHKVRRPGIATGLTYALAAAVIVTLVVGGAALLLLDRRGDDVAASVEWCHADWTGVTFAPRDDCPEPSTRGERAIAAIVAVMEPDNFAGLWHENDDLVVGYVGSAPDLELLPGVSRLVERTMTLAEMEQLAAERNENEDIGSQWRVNVAQGTVEKISREPSFFGDSIQTWEWCSTAVPHWLEVGATDPDFYSFNDAGTRYLLCVNEGTGEWETWELSPGDAKPYVP